MKSITPQKTHKKLILSLLITLGIILSLIAFLYYFKTGPFAPKIDNSINLDKPTEEEKKTGNDTKEDSVNQADSGKENIGSDPSPTPKPIEDSDKKSVAMEVTAANQTDSKLQIRTLIQSVVNSGTCSLSMKNTQGATYSTTTGVQALSSTSTCAGFDIPLDQLTRGAWTININFTNNELVASVSKEIIIQ